MNVVRLAVVDERGPGQVRVELALVHGRQHLGVGLHLLQVLDLVVAHSDAPRQPQLCNQTFLNCHQILYTYTEQKTSRNAKIPTYAGHTHRESPTIDGVLTESRNQKVHFTQIPSIPRRFRRI